MAGAEGVLDSPLPCPSLSRDVLLTSGIITHRVATQISATRVFHAVVNSKNNKANLIICME